MGIGLLYRVTHQLNIGSHQDIQGAYYQRKQQAQLALLTARLQAAALKAGGMPPNSLVQLLLRKHQLCSGLQAGIGHKRTSDGVALSDLVESTTTAASVQAVRPPSELQAHAWHLIWIGREQHCRFTSRWYQCFHLKMTVGFALIQARIGLAGSRSPASA